MQCMTSQLVRAPSLQRSLCFPSNYYQAVNKLRSHQPPMTHSFVIFPLASTKDQKAYLPFCSLSNPTTTPRAPFTSPWDTSRFFANITYREKEKPLMHCFYSLFSYLQLNFLPGSISTSGWFGQIILSCLLQHHLPFDWNYFTAFAS